MLIQTGRMANSSYAKMHMPMNESGADVNPVDAIGGGTYVTSVTSAGSGTSIALGSNASTVLSGGALPVIDASDSFLLMLTANDIAGMGLNFGDLGFDASLVMSESFGDSNVLIKPDNEVVYSMVNENFGSLTTAGCFSFLIDRNTQEARFYRNGVLSADVLDISASADAGFSFNTANLRLSNFTGICMDCFVFKNSAPPADVQAAMVDMGNRRLAGDYRIFPAWELK